MIRREDFIFTIGYEGNMAVVDGHLKKRYGSLSTEALAEEGLLKQALCSAIYAKAQEELEQVLSIYNKKTQVRLNSVDELKRTFGVFEVPEKTVRVKVI